MRRRWWKRSENTKANQMNIDMTMGVRKGDKVHGTDREKDDEVCVFCQNEYEDDGDRLIEFAGIRHFKGGYAHTSCLRQMMEECMSALGV